MTGFRIASFGWALPGGVTPASGEEWPRTYDASGDEFIPKNARRRMTRLTCLAVAATRAAGGLDAAPGAPLLFATANGEINTIAQILGMLADPEPAVSPTLFHNSVHNAGPGYWSILSKRLAAATTLTAGDLSFETAMLDAWARLAAGESEVQVTAGDEAIERAAWADPAHCTHDFAGSLRLAAGDPRGAPAGTALPGTATLVSVAFHRALDADRVLAGLGTASADRDLSAAGGAPGPALPGGARNPCAGLYFLLRFLSDPARSGTWAWQKAGPEGDCLTLAVRKD